MSKVSCQQCEGRGVITTHQPKVIGRASDGSPVHSAINTAVPQNRFCGECKGTGKVGAQAPTDPRPEPMPIIFGGVEVDAPGFTQDQFERAICRALADDLTVTVDATGAHIVGPAGSGGGYYVTRQRCTCKAGECGTPCKHRAVLIVHLDVREPAIRRQWAEARQAVAA